MYSERGWSGMKQVLVRRCMSWYGWVFGGTEQVGKSRAMVDAGRGKGRCIQTGVGLHEGSFGRTVHELVWMGFRSTTETET